MKRIVLIGTLMLLSVFAWAQDASACNGEVPQWFLNSDWKNNLYGDRILHVEDNVIVVDGGDVIRYYTTENIECDAVFFMLLELGTDLNSEDFVAFFAGYDPDTGLILYFHGPLGFLAPEE